MPEEPKRSIFLADIGGMNDAYQIIPGINLELWNGKTQVQVINGVIGKIGEEVRRAGQFELRLIKVGDLESTVVETMAIQLDGNNYENVFDFAPEETPRGQVWQTIVPVIWHDPHGNAPYVFHTNPATNSLKLIVFERGGLFSEHTVSVVGQNQTFYLIHQVNRDRFQCFRDSRGVFDPKSESRGKQPKRTQLSEKIATVFADDTRVPRWKEGTPYQPAPDRSGLEKDTARIMHWTARRGVGAAVIQSGEQVQVHWKQVRGTGFRYLEPGSVVRFAALDRAHGGGAFRHALKGVTPESYGPPVSPIERLATAPGVRVETSSGVTTISGD